MDPSYCQATSNTYLLHHVGPVSRLANVIHVLITINGETPVEYFVDMLHRYFDTFLALERSGNLTAEQFVAALVNQVLQRLYDQVARGALSEEKVEYILREVTQRLLHDLGAYCPVEPTAIPAETFDQPSSDQMPFTLQQIATILSLSPEELHQLLFQGYSIAEIAQKSDLSLEELVDALFAPLYGRAS